MSLSERVRTAMALDIAVTKRNRILLYGTRRSGKTYTWKLVLLRWVAFQMPGHE